MSKQSGGAGDRHAKGVGKGARIYQQRCARASAVGQTHALASRAPTLARVTLRNRACPIATPHHAASTKAQARAPRPCPHAHRPPLRLPLARVHRWPRRRRILRHPSRARRRERGSQRMATARNRTSTARSALCAYASRVRYWTPSAMSPGDRASWPSDLAKILSFTDDCGRERPNHAEAFLAHQPYMRRAYDARFGLRTDSVRRGHGEEHLVRRRPHVG